MGWWSDFWDNLVGGAGATVAVQEAGLPAFDLADPDLDLPGNQAAQNWRRLTQSSADLSPLTHERQQEMALYLSDRNPLARGVVDLATAFVVGEGFSVTSKDEDVQQAIDRFWDDGANDMAARIEDFTRELGIYGEQIVLAFVHDRSGRVALVSADPRTVTKVAPHPLASDRPYAVCFTGRDTTEERWIKIIAEDDDPTSDTFGRLVGQRPGETLRQGDRAVPFYQPPDQDGTRLAGCFFTAINKPRAAMRGRSDLLPVADFVDLYDRLIFDEAERMSFLRAFVWDVKITGADAATLQQRAVTEPPPKPGSVKLHNESEEWTAVSPDLNSDDSQTTADLILSLVATGVGLPKVWLNGLMDANRATAQETADPALKRLVARQRIVRRAIERMVRFALDCAEAAGALKPADDARHAFTVSAPEMSAKDLERAARSLLTATQAMGMANAAGWVDEQTAQDAVALLVGQLGLDIDLADLRERLEAMKAEGETQDDYEIPAYFGMGKSAGSDNLANALKDRTNGAARNGTAHAADEQPMAPRMDPTTVTDIISKISKSLVELGNARVIDGVFAQDVVAKLFAELGIEVDPVEMQQRLESEKAEAEAAEQAAAEPAEGEDGEDGGELPDDPDDLIDLDAMAVQEVIALGLLDRGRPLGAFTQGDFRHGLTLLAEAFDASLHPRGEGGRFAKKAKPAEDQGGGDAGGGAVVSPEVEARAMELAKEMIAQQKAKKTRAPRKPKDPNAPKKERKKQPPTMKTDALRAEIEALSPGREVTIELANGLSVSGTVEVVQGGVAMLKTGDGKYAVLHDRLKGVARIKTPAGASSGGG